MPDRTKFEVIKSVIDRGVIARLRADGTEESIRAAATALADGGAKVIQLILPKPGDEAAVAALIEHLRDQDPEVVLGAGPLDDPDFAASLLNQGLDFVAGSFFDLDMARICNGYKLLYLPLCSDPEEVELAEESGLELIRYGASSPRDLVEVLAERPWSTLSPVQGLRAGEIEPWLQAGAAFISLDFNPAGVDLTGSAADLIWETDQARGLPLFSGVEHVGTYPGPGQNPREIVDWYRDNLGFSVLEGEAFFFVSSSGPGRIEILKETEPVRAHVAIKVRHLGAAIKVLEEKGFAFEPVKDFGRVKAVFLKDLDPAGNKVHLLYQALG